MTMICTKCGTVIEHPTPVPRYKYKALGVPVILLNAVEIARCPKCRSVEGTLIPNLTGLIASAAVQRICIPIRLNGEEIRFLREALDYSGVELADKLDVRNELISRCEHDTEAMGVHLERNFRSLVFLRLRRYAIIRARLDNLLTMRFQPVRPVGSVPILLRLVEGRKASKSVRRAVQQKDWQADVVPMKQTG
jgi:hypothetical protein